MICPTFRYTTLCERIEQSPIPPEDILKSRCIFIPYLFTSKAHHFLREFEICLFDQNLL